MGFSQIPVIIDICRDMEAVCPDAWLLEYANPLSTICWAINDYTKVKNVGLCHSVPHTAAQLAKYIGKPIEEVSYWVAGINHFAWSWNSNGTAKTPIRYYARHLKTRRLFSRRCALGGRGYSQGGSLKNIRLLPDRSQFHYAYYMPYFRKSSRPDIMENTSWKPGAIPSVIRTEMRLHKRPGYRRQKIPG